MRAYLVDVLALKLRDELVEALAVSLNTDRRKNGLFRMSEGHLAGGSRIF